MLTQIPINNHGTVFCPYITFLENAPIAAGMGFAVGGPGSSAIALATCLGKFFVDQTVINVAPEIAKSPCYALAEAAFNVFTPSKAAEWFASPTSGDIGYVKIAAGYMLSRSAKFITGMGTYGLIGESWISTSSSTFMGFMIGKFWMSKLT